ncbi:MAG: TfoX/Sxy family protein [Bacteroidetes bacterium]|nr:TfoX/Sxy family protein [Bacteroidota bacterium]
MAYDIQLADRVRAYIAQFPNLKIEEKRMFGGLAFLVNGRMCVNVSGDNLMCRFSPIKTEELSKKAGFLQMVMRGKIYRGYCYVEPKGIRTKKDFEFWINECLAFNKEAKTSKQKYALKQKKIK